MLEKLKTKIEEATREVHSLMIGNRQGEYFNY